MNDKPIKNSLINRPLQEKNPNRSATDALFFQSSSEIVFLGLLNVESRFFKLWLESIKKKKDTRIRFLINFSFICTIKKTKKFLRIKNRCWKFVFINTTLGLNFYQCKMFESQKFRAVKFVMKNWIRVLILRTNQTLSSCSSVFFLQLI